MMANNINISQGDIPETDAEVEKLLAKKPAKRVKKLSLVQAPEAPAKVQRQLEDQEIQAWVESATTATEMQERADHANAGYPVMVDVVEESSPDAVVKPAKAKREKAAKEKQVKPAKSIEKHTAMAWHSSVNGLECYGYTSQEILDVADKVYTLYQQTPTIHLYGECLYGDKVLRLSQEQAVYKNVTNDAWHLPLLDIDVEPIDGTFKRARVGVVRPGTFEHWEQTEPRKLYRSKLLDSLKS